MRLFSQDTKVQALKRVPLFEGLSRKELVQLERVCEDLEVEPGKVLCKEGEIGHEFFVIVEGTADVERGGKKIAKLGPGDFFGEIALIAKTPRNATITTTSPVRALVITDRAFRRLLDHSPKIQVTVLTALAERLAPMSL